MSPQTTAPQFQRQGAKHYLKFPAKAALIALNKLSNRSYKKFYPRYLRWLGVNISPSSASYGDPWISPACVFDAAGYNLITIGDGTTISFDTVLLVYELSIDKSLYERDKSHGKLISPVAVGRNWFIGARTLVLSDATIGDNCVVGASSSKEPMQTAPSSAATHRGSWAA
ncbi:acyltransferase [Collinsella ihumii]|uniref:acyltransferase n=1 Tax=Collinsella ihumii TaxID=1720204 RepID=UPI00082E0ECF|nr:hypothetical protein [Collinsella ihumii]